ncbi:hypothetical protein BRARA_J00350 [Brassica rapa]|uniref:PGG domain-containing protein n=3 Tax=Brassica TaxID=3705 RepID=A0A397XQL5_BRACM|nr:hypothetical protein IGI04_039489 [Brassica rapa subsp. trilocularis]RID40293.1 hypothetical protein BRARA_J00350 [Brassica rapa]CAG7909180.1 unnamed protein product [Brassica rapa]
MGEGEEEGKIRCSSTVIIFCCIFLIVGLDVFAGFVAMQAEDAQQEVKQRVWLPECKSPSKKAFVLGLIALGCLLAAHIIAVMIGCSLSNTATVISGPEITEHINMACISLTWIIATAGVGILTMGIWTNRESRSECGFTNKHFLFLGGIVCFLHASISVVFYLTNIVSKKCCLRNVY